MTGRPPRIAVVDGASFVLPYDLQLVSALVRAGAAVEFFGSRTRYNGDLLDAMARLPGVTLHLADVSSSVAPRWRGVPAYLGLLWRLWRARARFDRINLQFAPAGWLELPCWGLLRSRLLLTVHDPVPHAHRARRHGPTAWLARRARQLVFASAYARDEFLRRYGARHAARAVLMPHGLLPVRPGEPPRVPRLPLPPQALVFWGVVEPYKGVDLFEALAADPGWRRLGVPLEVHGRWAASLQPLAQRLRALGVTVVDGYLDAAALERLLARPVIFLLPYRRASQSGALYTLLHAGCTMLCSDTGDLGDTLRRHGLQALLLRDRSPAAVVEALERLRQDPGAVQAALRHAQQAADWDAALQAAADAYALRP